MLRVEISVVVYVPGELDNEQDLLKAYDIEFDVEQVVYEKYKQSDVKLHYVGTESVRQDDTTYKE